MTLTRFITAYIYTPILISFKSFSFKSAMVVTLITMTIAGLWHGASWCFVMFGFLHGIGLIINHTFIKSKIKYRYIPLINKSFTEALNIGILESKGDFKTDIRKLEPIFRSFKLNSRILKVTDIIVTKFLEDTVVDDEIELANTKHNFFSQHVWNESMLRVIDKKIRQEEDEILALKKLVNSLF